MLLTNAQKKNNKPLQQQQHQLQHEKENRRDKYRNVAERMVEMKNATTTIND